MKSSVYEKIILGIFTGYALSILFVRLAIIFSYLPETGGVSINMMYGIIHLANTGILYMNPEDAPFSIIQYMPLHYYIVSGTGHLLNISGDLHQMMVLNRVLCFIGGLIYSFLIYRGMRIFFPNAGMRAAYFGGLLFFILIPSHNYGRLDNLYFSFSLAALLYFMRYVKDQTEQGSSNLRALLLAGIFCGFALLTKQTGVIVTVLFSGWLILAQNSIKDFIRFAAATILPVAIFLFYIMPENPSDFTLNVINGIRNGIDLNWFYYVIVKYYFAETGFIIAFGIYIAIWVLFERKNSLKSFLAVSILFFFATALAMSPKGGSNAYYFLEFTFMTFFGLGYLLNKNPEYHKPYLPYFTLLIPFFLMSTINDKGWHELGRMKKAKNDYANCMEVADYVNQKLIPGNFIYSNFHLENSLNLFLYNSTLFPCREVAFKFTRPQGTFHFNKFDTLVKNGNVQFVIDKKDEFPAKVLDTDLQNFVKDTTIGNYSIYQFASK
jgi:hypothetical protein